MRILRLSIAALVAVLLLQPAQAADKVNVVATFSILADFVRNVGGERVEVTALVGPGADVHVYTPSPSDAKITACSAASSITGWTPNPAAETPVSAGRVTSANTSSPRRHIEVRPRNAGP